MSRKPLRGMFLFFLTASLALMAMGAAPPVDPPSLPGVSADHRADTVLVKFHPGTGGAAVAEAHRNNGGTVVDSIQGIDVQVVRVPAGTAQARVQAYSRNPNVEFAELDYVATAVGQPSNQAVAAPAAAVSDQLTGQQWSLGKINAYGAWDLTRGSSSVAIAILDTGIASGHPDLAGKVVRQVDFTGSASPEDVYGHGTHVAGIAAAATNNSLGVAGVGYDSALWSVKVLGDNGSGYYSWISSGITWAADNGAKVINMSLGAGTKSSALEHAVNYAWDRGVVVVAAAGNNGRPSAFYPAYYRNVIAVAATTSSDGKAGFSNYGSKWVDVAAPGVGILSTVRGGGYASWDGTSMASPHVAGLAALLFARNGAVGSGASNATVRSQIEANSDRISGTGTYWQYGRINAFNSVRSVN